MSDPYSHQLESNDGQTQSNIRINETQPLLSSPAGSSTGLVYSTSTPATPLPSYQDSTINQGKILNGGKRSPDGKQGGIASPRDGIVDSPGTPRPSEEELEAAHGNTDQPPKRKMRSIAFSAVLSLLAAVLLFFFIKAFIDADDVDFDLKKALKKALGGGLSGAAAMVLQVLSLMPLRTTMNYQYRFGNSMTEALHTLYNAGGVSRFYDGLGAALVQGPLSRFGDTAANAGILALLESNTFMRKLPSPVKTIFASVAAAAFRIVLTPVDTLKTTLQTQGRAGVQILKNRIKRYGVGTLWYGALATAAATFVGHYPWFGTYNYLEGSLPAAHTLMQTLARQAFIGFVASIVSDTVSNSLRVVKTYRQVNDVRIGYWDAAREVIRIDGIKGLFGRGLKTRILANGLQGLMFSVLWKLFMDLWDKQTQR